MQGTSLAAKEGSPQIHFVSSLVYSLVLHVFFGVMVLYAYLASQSTIDRPTPDYITIMLLDKTDVVKEPTKLNVQPKKLKPVVRKKVPAVPKEPLPEPQKEEPLLPSEVKPSPPIEEPPPPVPAQPQEPPVAAEPPPVSSPLPQEPEPVQEAPPSEPEPIETVEAPTEASPQPPVEVPPPLPAPVLPLDEQQPPPPPQEAAPALPLMPAPPPVVASTEVEQELTESQPTPSSPEAPPAINPPETLSPAQTFPTPPPIINLPEMPPPQPEPPITVSKSEEAPLPEQTKPEAQALPPQPVPEEPASLEPAAPAIIVTEPQEGAILQMARGSAVTIRGTVDDPEIKTAVVIFNGAQVEVEVHEGRFETVLPGVAEENTLLVEATNAASLTGQSASVIFFTRQPEPKDILVVLSCKATCADVRLTALKGEHPQSRSYMPFKSPMRVESSTVEHQNGSSYAAKFMTIPRSESGVYTIRLDSDSSQTTADCDPRLFVILYGYDRDRLRARVFQPSIASNAGQGPWILARFLMPQGFFWDDDGWTTGQIEDGRSVTKFSSSLGIVWKELK